MITFEEIDRHIIQKKYPNHFHEKARYFQAVKDKRNLCIYGLISYNENIGEAFLIMNSFVGKVFSKDYFISLFNHSFGLDFKEIYTWTKWAKLIRTFEHFKSFGIEKTTCPPWDNDETKTWFMKRI